MATETVHTTEEQTTLAPPPRRYAVIIKNDDFTPMDFVVEVLVDVFNVSPPNALMLMMQVHNSGSGIAGVYSKDVAETKAAIALTRAKEQSHPFLCLIEPAA